MFLFLFFGRMTQMKGVHILAKALPSVLEKHPEAHAVLVGASDSPAPDGRSMREYILDSCSSVLSRIHLLDKMPHSQLYPFIRNSRFVVLPSLVDNMPNACLEAMGLGKPVVATMGSCFEELIQNGISGWLVPPSDPQALGKAIQQAWSEADLKLQEMGKLAALRIAELHPSQLLPKLLDYYNFVLSDFSKNRTNTGSRA